MSFNLYDAVPDHVRAIQDGGPPAYSKTDRSDLSGRSGDIGNETELESASDNVLYAPTGDYQLETTIGSDGGDVVGIEGDGSDQTTIYYNSTDLDFLVNLITSANLILRGFTLDITEDTGIGDGIPDIGVVHAWVSDNSWCEDVRVRGPRKRWQDLDGDGTADETVGGYYSWHIDVTDPNSWAYQENIDLSDGLIYEPDSTATHHFQQGIGFSLEAGNREHVGDSIFYQCDIRDWANNGYYLSNPASGSGYLWDCYVENTMASGMRLGRNDMIIGGKSVRNTNIGGVTSYPVRHDYGPAEIIGVTIEGTAYDYALSIQTDATDCILNRVVMDAHDGSNNPVRVTADATVDISDCYWYDSSSSSSPTVYLANGTITADADWRVLSEAGPEIDVRSGATVTYDNSTLATGTHHAADLGMEDPRVDDGALPTMYFDDAEPGAYDRTVEVLDAITNEGIEGAEVWLYARD